MKAITIAGRSTKDSEVRQKEGRSLQPFLSQLQMGTDKTKE